jgi:hypothetical protein
MYFTVYTMYIVYYIVHYVHSVHYVHGNSRDVLQRGDVVYEVLCTPCTMFMYIIVLTMYIVVY